MKTGRDPGAGRPARDEGSGALRIREAGAERRPVRFVFDGRPIVALEGDTVAAALVAHGVRVFGRSSKYHRPRGLRCGNGTCSCCAMRVDGLPGVRTCVTPVREGMVVEREHAWPSAEFDLMRGGELAAPLLHAGFYYRWFRRSPRLWSTAERLLARAAGQGDLPSAEAARRLAGARLRRRAGVGVLVVGGGPAGLSAALAAAEGGAEVVLAERHPALGGAAAPTGSGRDRAEVLERAVRQHPRVEVLAPAEVAGWYDEGVVALTDGDDLVLMEPAAVVLAAGAHELLLPFRGGDLPGVIAAGAARRLLRGGVRPGRAVVLVTDRSDGYALAAELTAHGVAVAAVADRRPARQVAADERLGLESLGIPLHTGLRDMIGHGRTSVGAVSLVLRDDDRARPQTARIACDVVCVAAGGRPAAELARQALAEGHFALAPVTLDGSAASTVLAARGPRLFLAGAANGCGSAAEAAADGEHAGRAAASCSPTEPRRP